MRADPDQLLKAIGTEKEEGHRGQLKIFFGYAAGVGKTYAMLEAAHGALEAGNDVVVGYVEPHTRPQTMALLDGLPVLPVKKTVYKGITLSGFDLDGVIARKPEIAVVDELAHTNAAGSRHTKRYQDVEELLKAGINVYTTVNVQHLESLGDRVAAITGVVVRERIPDRIFDNADQVELVDIEPAELITRLGEGKIYREKQASQAVKHFFSGANLTALREIALRRCADRVNRISENVRIQSNSTYYTDEHILVCLSSSPTNPKIIRTAARMAQAFRARFSALYVATPEAEDLDEEDARRLKNNTHLAEQLGAAIETVTGDDIALQIAEFARLSGVSKIVVGRSNARHKRFGLKANLTEQLITDAPELDVYIIPDEKTNQRVNIKRTLRQAPRIIVSDVVKSFLILIAATTIGFLFYHLHFSEANIITVYILSVLITAIVTTRRSYSLVSSLISVLIFNFCFTDPKWTFNAYDSGYPVTFAIMFIAAFITSSLAVRIKQHAKQSALVAYRTKVLLDTNQFIQKASGRTAIIAVTAGQIIKLLDQAVVFYPVAGGQLETPQVFPKTNQKPDLAWTCDNERAVAAWVCKNNKRAGATTGTLGESRGLYHAVRVNQVVYGVVGVMMCGEDLEAFQNSILLSILGECALALENDKVSREREQAAIMAKNEQLRANLLRAISHDLRTPLTAISGNASILMANSGDLSETQKLRLETDIHDDALWLINLVENLLAVTRIEDGTMNLTLTPELMDDVVETALTHLRRDNPEKKILYQPSPEMLVAKMDAHLIVQVIINLVDNGIKYTPPQSAITVRVYPRKKGTARKPLTDVVVEVADQGPGIADAVKPRIFDMFYTGENKIADNRRSLGLGLALCKSIVTAHNGTIAVYDNKPVGTIFRFSLPAKEVSIDEG
ncbi:MAG: sensor histidine kinase KdpD [Eubacteriaceae bacterium]|nr:sensor histidine kinase KdpD [Eubacteriaceae bacterium]